MIRKKICFMHINKTAGKSIVKWLHDNGHKVDDFQDVYNTFNNNNFYFTVVRNPYDRIASQFFHWRDNLKRIDSKITLDFYVENIRQPEKWLLNGNHPWFYSRLNQSCKSWIKSDIIKVFKFENLKEMENYFFVNFGFTCPLPHINKTKNLKSYSHFYNKNSIKIINDLLKDDFETFNYNRI